MKQGILTRIKTFVTVSLSAAIYYSGVLWLYRRFSRKGAGIKILTYHGVDDVSYLNLHVPPKVFEYHLSYLVNHGFNLIPLEDAVKLLKSKKPIPRDTVVITFDDGYRNNYTHAYPIIKRYKAPVTIFISIDPIIKRYSLFVDTLVYVFDKTGKKNLDLSTFGLGAFILESERQKEPAIRAINEFSKSLNGEARKKLIEFIAKQLGVDLDVAELRDKMLTLGEIEEMNRNGIAFGAHTLTHPSLPRIPLAEARDEVIKSRKVIEEHLKKNVKTFAYPYGSPADFNENICRTVEAGGFSCACTLVAGTNTGGEDPFLLKRDCITSRIKPGPMLFFSKALFAVELSGILDPLKSMIKDLHNGY